MGSHSFSEMFCLLCSTPVDLCVDLCTDENGNSVHQNCYVKRITSSFIAGASELQPNCVLPIPSH